VSSFQSYLRPAFVHAAFFEGVQRLRARKEIEEERCARKAALAFSCRSTITFTIYKIYFQRSGKLTIYIHKYTHTHTQC
jgi:hypothetical protein